MLKYINNCFECDGSEKMKKIGLTSEEVEELVDAGKTNFIKDKSSKSIFQIIFFNVFTYFNGIFCFLSILLMLVGSFKNLAFLLVVFLNIIIGIIQQLRAKRVLDKLALLDSCDYVAVRDGEEISVSSEMLVLGDVIKLQSGQQIPADAVVISGEAYVNESLLTGEVDEIQKKKNSELKSGSFIVSGDVFAKLTKVGKDSYIYQLTEKAKEVKEKKSDMIADIEKIIRVAGFLIIPIGLLLMYQSVYVNGLSYKDAVTSMVGAIIGMIPEGMYLLVTVVFALSSLRLSKVSVLLHDMKSIETLARIDVLCVDKTGTITSNRMSVADVFGSYKESKSDIKNAISVFSKYVNTITDNNITICALREYFDCDDKMEYDEIVPFSSKKKYSQISTSDFIYRLGAPEFLLSDDIIDKNRSLIENYTGKGERVIVFTKEVNGDNVPILFVSLYNEIRDTAQEIFKYFQAQKIDIKVISGDNPLTVSKVALEAKIKNAEKYIDATTLDSYEKICDAVKKYTVFGRVKPEQKQQIIKAIKSMGLKVAMTGDGVNDILAMKEADCSIAMGEGSDAARKASQVVLLDSDFSHMKNIVYEGRRDINNITRSASLFLYKNIFSLLLSVFSIIAVFKYPLQPTQISMISMFNIGLPAFLLAMEPNEEKQERKFLTQVLINSIPAALTSFFTIVAMIYFADLFDISSIEVGTASVYLISVVGFNILWDITRPLNKYHIIVFMICALGIVLCSRYLYNIFDIEDISIKATVLCFVFAIAEMTIIRDIRYFINLFMQKKRNV